MLLTDFRRDMMHGLLMAGWLTFGALQGGDLVTTHQAIARGGVESNAMMSGPLPAQIAIKAGTTTGLVLWSKQHPKAGTVVVWALNGLYAGIVAHNAGVNRR